MRTALLFFAVLAVVNARDPAGWKVSKDLPYVSYGAARQTLDLHIPPGPGPHPLVIWIQVASTCPCRIVNPPVGP